MKQNRRHMARQKARHKGSRQRPSLHEQALMHPEKEKGEPKDNEATEGQGQINPGTHY